MLETKDAKGMQETVERAASAWWDVWAKSPAFLGQMGKLLEAQLGVRKVAQKAMDEWLEAMRIPSFKDQAELLDRIAALEAKVALLERAAGAAPSAGPKAS